jgi:hypothetical protein
VDCGMTTPAGGTVTGWPWARFCSRC